MSDDWRGWYQNKPGSGDQPAEAYQGGGAGRAAANRAGAWPSQPPHQAGANQNGGTWAVAAVAAGGSGGSRDGAAGGSR